MQTAIKLDLATDSLSGTAAHSLVQKTMSQSITRVQHTSARETATKTANVDIFQRPTTSDELLIECSRENTAHALNAMNSSANGITTHTARTRTREYGPNKLLAFEKTSWFRLLKQVLAVACPVCLFDFLVYEQQKRTKHTRT